MKQAQNTRSFTIQLPEYLNHNVDIQVFIYARYISIISKSLMENKREKAAGVYLLTLQWPKWKINFRYL